MNYETSGTDEEIPDCEDPDAMAWNEHTKTGIKGTISGAGKMDQASVSTFWNWLNSDDAKVCQVEYGDSFTTEGPWKLTAFSVSGNRGSVATVNLTMVSHGVHTGT